MLAPVRIDDPRELIELLSGAMSEIIGGGILIDVALGNEEFGYFDLVAVNEEREGVFFFINFSGDETEYLRLLKCMRWYQENHNTIRKLYAGRVALGPAPPVFVVAPRYSYSMQKVLLNIRKGPITLLKYVCFQDSDGEKSLFIEKVGDSSIVARKADSMLVPETHPPGLNAYWPKTEPAEKIAYLAKFRRDIEADISNVTDEELLDLLGSSPQ
jgi:hypothetical protein